MHIVMDRLNTLSLNCHGYNMATALYLNRICSNFDVILLQETWLSSVNCNKLDNINDFVSVHTSAMEEKLVSNMFTGLPFGGTAILLRKSLGACSYRIVTNNPRVTAVRCQMKCREDLVICSVYIVRSKTAR